MRIAFLTDLHLGRADEYPRGVDVRQNLLDALGFLPRLKPDALVIGGDVCLETGQADTYRWFRQQLDALPCPWYVVPGNHDDSALLARELGLDRYLHDGELYVAERLGEVPALFLDTSRGTCSDAQWDWLRAQVAALRGTDALVVMHHPPVPAGVGHMDANYPFRQSERFLETVRPLRRVVVLCGHYHVEKVVLRDNLTVLLTPSLFFQMKHDPVELVLDHLRIGVRELNWRAEAVTSTVHYREGNRVG